MKKIISYSLFGDDYRWHHCRGALANLRRTKQLYPEWICRFYVSQEIPEGRVNRLLERGGKRVEIIRKTRKHKWDGLFWRFLAVDDDEAQIVIVRDADSIVTPREAMAVQQWLDSGKNFHIMRDHPAHKSRIMGGAWGCLAGAFNERMADMIGLWGKTHPSAFTAKDKYADYDDQAFLARIIYPRIKDDTLIHYSAGRIFEGEKTSPFPQQRPTIASLLSIHNSSDEPWVGNWHAPGWYNLRTGLRRIKDNFVSMIPSKISR